MRSIASSSMLRGLSVVDDTDQCVFVRDYWQMSSAKDGPETALHVAPTVEHGCPSGLPVQRLRTQVQLRAPQVSAQLSVEMRVHVGAGGSAVSSQNISLQ